MAFLPLAWYVFNLPGFLGPPPAMGQGCSTPSVPALLPSLAPYQDVFLASMRDRKASR